MPGPVYQDSLARSEPYSMLYDTIRNPYAPSIPPKKQAISPDSIESTQQKIDREVLAKFQGTGMRLPHDSFVTVVQVGKYLFLAIMLPPYLCLYGLPKWFFTTLIPQIFGIVKTHTLQVGKFLQESTKYVVDVMKGMLEQTIGDALKMSYRQSQNFFRYLAKNVKKGIVLFANAWASTKEKVGEFKPLIQNPFVIGYQKALGKFQSGWNTLKAKVSEIAEAIVNRSAAFAETLADNLLYRPLQWMRSWISNQQKPLDSREQPHNPSLFKRIADSFTSGIAAIQSAVVEFTKQCEHMTEVFVMPIVRLLMDRVETVERFISETRDKFSRSIAEISRKVSKRMEEFLEPKMEYISQLVHHIPEIAVQAAYWMWGFVPQPVKHLIERQYESTKRFGRALKKFGNAISNGVTKVVGAVATEFLRPFLNWWEIMMAKLRKAFQWLRWQLIDLPRKVEVAAIKLWHSFKILVARFFRSIRVAFAWGRLIIRHSFGLVKELADEIWYWVSYQK